MKALHIVNCVLFLLNAVLWAWLARQPAVAVLCLSIGLAEAFIVKRTDLVTR